MKRAWQIANKHLLFSWLFYYMAVLACLLGKRFVHLFLEKLGILRGVGRVAVPAIHHLGADINMGFPERSLFIVMAFSA